MICLDTCSVIFLINKKRPLVRARFDQAIADGSQIAVPTIVLHELWCGVEKSQKKQANTQALQGFLAGPVVLLDFNSNDAQEAGNIRAALEAKGTPIGPYDVLIAAQARGRNALLITANSDEFKRVPGLTIDDWSTAP